jgi:hypothetical protein
MNLNLIEHLKKGLFLEISNEIIPWKTPFKELKKIGNPELKKYSEQRTDLIWKNESILNGLNVNLNVMNWSGIGGLKKKFTHAYSNISEKEFKEMKVRFDSEFGEKGKYKKINELEHKFCWNLEQCKVELIEKDRFGTYWTITIEKKNKFWF